MGIDIQAAQVKFMKRSLFIAWKLVDTLNPPWIRAIGAGFSFIWLACCLAPGHLITSDDDTIRNLALVFNDNSWAVVNLIVFMITSWSMYDFSNLTKRNVALITLLVYWLGASSLLILGLWIRPLGWLHFYFGVIAAVAFFRPLLLDWIVEARVQLFLKEEQSTNANSNPGGPSATT